LLIAKTALAYIAVILVIATIIFVISKAEPVQNVAKDAGEKVSQGRQAGQEQVLAPG
jgi:hypothetical protein